MKKHGDIRVIKGKVKDTGYPIDGCILILDEWPYDLGNWHLRGWMDADDKKVMQTMYESEVESGLSIFDTIEEFQEMWDKKEWDPQGVFCIPAENVDIVKELGWEAM